MATQPQTPAETVSERACKCQLGWTGTAGSGSRLDLIESYPNRCDRVTRRSFAQGHDARMSSRLAKEIANNETPAEVAVKIIQAAGGTPALVAKTLHSAQLRIAKANKAADAIVDGTNDDEAEDNEALAQNMASDEGITIERARERLGVDAPEDSDEPPADDEPNLPEVGIDWKVKHGKRTYTAKVTEFPPTGERFALHKLGQGRDCYHDLATGEIVELHVDQDEVPF